jgi:hypothetical protein
MGPPLKWKSSIFSVQRHFLPPSGSSDNTLDHSVESITPFNLLIWLGYADVT